MAAYMIARINVTDMGRYKEYIKVGLELIILPLDILQ